MAKRKTGCWGKGDTQKIKALEERIKELERVIGQKQLLLEFKDKMIEIAEATYNVDIKKVGSGSRLVLLQPGTTPKGLSRLFEVLDISKQSFYQMLKRRRYKYEEQEQLVLINESDMTIRMQPGISI
ncbi:MAG: hypothetical protein R2744_05805 [Bacteroidales bacterium]